MESLRDLTSSRNHLIPARCMPDTHFQACVDVEKGQHSFPARVVADHILSSPSTMQYDTFRTVK